MNSQPTNEEIARSCFGEVFVTKTYENVKEVLDSKDKKYLTQSTFVDEVEKIIKQKDQEIAELKAEVERFKLEIKLIKEPCCDSCIEDKSMGYGDDITNCCCRHSHNYKADEFLREENKELKAKLTHQSTLLKQAKEALIHIRNRLIGTSTTDSYGKLMKENSFKEIEQTLEALGKE